MKLEAITSGQSLTGVEPTAIVQAVATLPIGPGSMQLIYRLPDGLIKERLLSTLDEAAIVIPHESELSKNQGDGTLLEGVRIVEVKELIPMMNH